MNDNKILSLIKSTNIEDIKIGVHLLAKYEDPRRFIRKNGKAIHMVSQSDLVLGPRYEINLKVSLGSAECYYKLKEGLYIVIHYREFVECYEPYNDKLPVVDLTT